jgi:hypothetical protein
MFGFRRIVVLSVLFAFVATTLQPPRPAHAGSGGILTLLIVAAAVYYIGNADRGGYVAAAPVADLSENQRLAEAAFPYHSLRVNGRLTARSPQPTVRISLSERLTPHASTLRLAWTLTPLTPSPAPVRVAGEKVSQSPLFALR